jgi:hypothetical protein
MAASGNIRRAADRLLLAERGLSSRAVSLLGRPGGDDSGPNRLRACTKMSFANPAAPESRGRAPRHASLRVLLQPRSKRDDFV